MEGQTSADVRILNWKISNIKCHFRIDRDLIDKRCVCSNRKGKTFDQNFCIVNDLAGAERATYIIYKKYVNVTGVDSLDSIAKAKTIFYHHFNTLLYRGIKPIVILPVVLDNILITGKFNLPFISLNSFFRFAQSQNVYVEYNNLLFPSLYLKDYKSVCTVCLFGSGKFNVLGLKCTETLDFILPELTSKPTILFLLSRLIIR